MSKIDQDDIRYLRRAIELSRQARAKGNGAYGAILVHADGRILALRVNTLANVGAYATGTGVAIQLLIGPWVIWARLGTQLRPRLHRALGQFMLDVQTGEHGYAECNPPVLVGDDGVMLGPQDGRLMAAPHPNTICKLEVRNVGLIDCPVSPPVGGITINSP